MICRRGSSCLRPGHAGFGLPALCMRALLDELALHVPLTPAEGQLAADSAAADEAAQRSTAVEGELDARFVQLCCPQLGQALQVHADAELGSISDTSLTVPPGMHIHFFAIRLTQGPKSECCKATSKTLIQMKVVGMQAGVSGATKEMSKKGLRKIRPTVPVLAPSAAPSVPVPAVVTRLAAGEQSDAKRKLQSAFLAMYSNSESKVPSMLCCRIVRENAHVFCRGVTACCLSVLVAQKPATCTRKGKGHCNDAESLLQVRMKSVVDFVSEVLSHTVKERCIKQSVAAACTAAAAQVRAEADEKLQPELATNAGLTADILRSQLQASVSGLLSDASAQVGSAMQEHRAGHVTLASRHLGRTLHPAHYWACSTALSLEWSHIYSVLLPRTAT